MRAILLIAFALLAGCRLNGPTDQPHAERPDLTRPEMTVYVAPFTRECVGMYVMQCMLVRTSPQEEWSNFYDEIQGFAYEPGFAYTLVVGSREIADPPADGSSREYWLIELVAKTPAQ